MITRSLVVVGSGARATLVETHEGRGQQDYQVNTALQLVVGDEAQVDHVKVTLRGKCRHPRCDADGQYRRACQVQ